MRFSTDQDIASCRIDERITNVIMEVRRFTVVRGYCMHIDIENISGDSGNL